MVLNFNDLKSQDLQKLDRDKTCFILGVGTPEDFGPHLPITTHSETAQAQAIELAQQLEKELHEWTFILGPFLPIGVESHTSQIALPVRPHVLRDWIVDTCRGYLRLGFRHFSCLSGNHSPKQLTAIEDAGKIIQRSGMFFTKKPIFLSLSSLKIQSQDFKRSFWFSDPIEHGGARDTAIALSSRPTRVDPSFELLPEVRLSESKFDRWLARIMGKTRGYWGSPATAQAKNGQKILKSQAQTIAREMIPILKKEKRARSQFRSWYSVLPHHKSFLKAWLLIIATLGLMFAWIYLSFKTFVG